MEVFGFVIGLLAGVAAAAMAPFLGVVLAPRRLAIEAEYEAARRASEAHSAAAAQLADDVARVYIHLETICVLFDQEFGSGVYWPPNTPTGSYIDNASGASDLLQEIWTHHPTDTVRSHARSLWDDVGAFWFEAMPDPTMRTTIGDRDRVFADLARAERLISLLHTPYPGPEPRRWSLPTRVIVGLLAAGLVAGILVWAWNVGDEPPPANQTPSVTIQPSRSVTPDRSPAASGSAQAPTNP